MLGLLDQWLIEGKFTEEEALSQSYDMLSAGIDTVKLLISDRMAKALATGLAVVI